MRYSLIIVALAITGCASQPPVKPMTDKDILLLKVDCKQQGNQIKMIEQQIASKSFYTVDGVEHSDNPTTINKRFYAVARMKIWDIREKCAR